MTTVTTLALTKPERAVRQTFLLALFCVGFSTALTNVFVGLSYLGFLAAMVSSSALRAQWRLPRRQLLPGLLALALLALYLLGSLWSVAPRADLLTALQKYTRLLILPMGIMLAWRDPALPRRALIYCLAGTVVLAGAIYMTSAGWMPDSRLGWWRVSTDRHDAYVFRNHITIGIQLGFAASASLLIASHLRAMRWRAAAGAGALAMALPIMFLSQGRTGYVVLFIGLVTVFLLRVRLTPLRTVAGLAAVVLLFAGLYAASPNVRTRTDAMVNEIETDQVRSPNGLRMSFIEVGLDTVAHHPLLGLGTGSFAAAYAPTALRNWPPGHEMAVARHQPHSEFLLTAVQLGMAGLAVYCGMLGALAWPALGRRAQGSSTQGRSTRTFERDMLALLWLIYTITSSFNSLLWDTTEAHWFLLLGSCLFVGAMRPQAAPASAARTPLRAHPGAPLTP